MMAQSSIPQGSLGVDVLGGVPFGFRPAQRQPLSAQPGASPYGDSAAYGLASWQRHTGSMKERQMKPGQSLQLSPPRMKLQPSGCFDPQFTPEPKKSGAGGPVQGGEEAGENAADLQGAGIIQVNCGQDFWRAQLDAIYSRRNPHKRIQLAEILEKYKGQEAVLYRKVCEKYDLCPTKFYDDPKAWVDFDGDTLEASANPSIEGHTTAEADSESRTFSAPPRAGLGAAIANLMSRLLCRRSAIDAAGLSCSQDRAASRRRLTLLLGPRPSWERAFTGPNAPASLFGSDPSQSASFAGAHSGAPCANESNVATFAPSTKTKGNDARVGVLPSGEHCTAPSTDACNITIRGSSKSNKVDAQARAPITGPSVISETGGADVRGSCATANAVSPDASDADKAKSSSSDSQSRECDTHKRRQLAIGGGDSSQQQVAEIQATSSSSAFAFRFATGSAVFGQLGGRQTPVQKQASAPPASRTDATEAAIKPVEMRRASPAVLAQRRLLQAKRVERVAQLHAGDREDPGIETGGLNRRVRAELKRKADRFESATSRPVPSRAPLRDLSNEAPAGLAEERLRLSGFVANKARRFDSVPSPARTGLMHENSQQRRRH